MYRIICLVVGYAFGLIQSAYIYGKLHGVDIRTVGSGNAGSTNTLRAFGTKAGLTVLFCDALKTVAAIWVIRLTLGRTYPELVSVFMFYTALGVILGHNFPFYLNFKGGKGMAATLGLLIALSPWYYLVFTFSLFVILFLTLHYVSLGCMVAYIFFVIETFIYGKMGLLGESLTKGQLTEIYILAVVMCLLAIFQHRKNLVRLFKGEESKTFLSKKGKEKYKAQKEASQPE